MNRAMAIMSPINAILLVSGLLLLVYNEYYEFLTVKQNQWTASEATLPPLTKSDGRDTVRILFVGDPQIQGYRDEPPLLGYVTRWDADRYLRTYYHHALNFVNPDVVIIMGDLLDEGSISEDWEFERYANWLKDIYRVPDDVKIIYLAGDNDIGGETDPLTQAKISRFERYFSPVTEAVQYKHVAFHKINILPYIHLPPNEKEDRLFGDKLTKMGTDMQSASINIVLSHTGISEAMLHRHIQIMRVLKPKYAFSAHSHYSSYMKHNLLQLVDFFKKVYPRDGSLNHIREDIFMEEYRIPTCSYRMGVPNMAYAAAVIDADGTLHYTLLWLPSRYRQLYRYAAFLVVVATIAFYRCMCRPRARRRHEYTPAYHSYNHL